MSQKLRNFAYFTKSALFTLLIHGVLIAALVVGLWWPFANKNERPKVKPIQAQVISEKEIQEQVDVQKKKLEEQKRVADELEALKKKKEEEEKRVKELEEKRKQEEIERVEREKEETARKAEEEKKRKADAEKKRKEEEKKKAEEEKKRKEEEERKRKEEEKRKAEEEKKRKEEEKRRREAEEKRQREEALRKQLEEEQIQAEAQQAMISFSSRITSAIEREWNRPASVRAGLVADIKIRVSRSGDVLSAQVVKSSGDAFFDRSAEVATKKASPLPFPPDPRYYEYNNTFIVRFNPDDY